MLTSGLGEGLVFMFGTGGGSLPTPAVECKCTDDECEIFTLPNSFANDDTASEARGAREGCSGGGRLVVGLFVDDVGRVISLVDNDDVRAMPAFTETWVDGAVVVEALLGTCSASNEYGGGGASSFRSFCRLSHSSYD